MVNLQGDLKRNNAIVELLVDENTKLRDHLSRKNKETTQLLETLGLNDGETVLKMRHQLEILESENKLLLSRLEESKVWTFITQKFIGSHFNLIENDRVERRKRGWIPPKSYLVEISFEKDKTGS